MDTVRKSRNVAVNRSDLEETKIILQKNSEGTPNSKTISNNQIVDPKRQKVHKKRKLGFTCKVTNLLSLEQDDSEIRIH